MAQVLEEDGSCRQAVSRVIAFFKQHGWDPPSSETGAYCRARHRLSEKLLARLIHQTGVDLEAQRTAQSLWHGFRLLAADGTGISMPDTPENQAEYPQPSSQAPGCGFPVLNLVVIFSLVTGALLQYALGSLHASEMVLFRALLTQLTSGDLLIADRYYGVFAVMAGLHQRGVQGVCRVAASRITDFRRGNRLGKDDHLVTWRLPTIRPRNLTDEEYAQLPQQLLLREGAVLGVVDQDVAVGQIEDARAPRRAGGVPSGLPELPADLERDEGLARAGGHGQKHAAAALQHGLHRAVDGDFLVVARRFARERLVGREQPFGLGVGQRVLGTVALPELRGRGEPVQEGLAPGQEVKFDDALSVGRVGERQAEDKRVVFGLLETVADFLVGWFGFDDGERKIAADAEDVVGAFLFFAADLGAARDDDAAVGEGALFGDGVRLVVSTRRQELGEDVLATGVRFGKHRWSTASCRSI